MTHAQARTHTPRPNPAHPRPWHHVAVFGDGPRRLLSPDERNIWTARLEHERHTGRQRKGRLTALHVKIGRRLLGYLGPDGRCDPSHAMLAEAEACSVRAVQEALTRMREAGLIQWEQRKRRVPWPENGPDAERAEQISNAYVFVLPSKPAIPAPSRPARSLRVYCDGRLCRESSFESTIREIARFLETPAPADHQPETVTSPTPASLSPIEAALASLGRAAGWDVPPA